MWFGLVPFVEAAVFLLRVVGFEILDSDLALSRSRLLRVSRAEIYLLPLWDYLGRQAIFTLLQRLPQELFDWALLQLNILENVPYLFVFLLLTIFTIDSSWSVTIAFCLKPLLLWRAQHSDLLHDDVFVRPLFDDKFLLKVKELALEAWIGKDHAAPLLAEGHRLEHIHVVVFHEVSDDAGCRSRHASITKSR